MEKNYYSLNNYFFNRSQRLGLCCITILSQ